MTISLYSAAAPVFVQMLGALSRVLKKAEGYAAERKIDPSVYLNMRLCADMFPLTRQVQIACDHAKGATARLSGSENPKFEDTEATFAELQARIEKTLAFVKSVPADKIDGQEERPINISFPGMSLDFTGQDYLLHYALPNFYFHVTTAYAILRHAGVPLGKADYFGRT
ncbi:DUF1993 domain-containing protein [Oryzibacter oryziterrae]|uniref:DUF1993 domain-containing protein n=1 Tax=Oryzibacter oryziterrae TaxID=2766474 RepID=UPI001F310386|nr:DUF1993 domain-containing protein [Oryzibacter oryziterrae]